MTIKKRPSRRRKTVQTRLEFADLGDKAAPTLKLVLRHADGEVEELKCNAQGEYELPEASVGKNARIEVSSDSGKNVRRYRFDNFIASAREEGIYRFAEAVWRPWFLTRYCVGGRVQVCRPYPILTDYATAELSNSVVMTRSLTELTTVGLDGVQVDRVLADQGLVSGRYQIPRFPVRCEPVCHGRVEVYVRTCCCPIGPIYPPDIWIDLCRIIDCDLELIPRPPFWPDGPIPLPGPGPGPIDRIRQATVQALERAEAEDDAPSKERVLWAARHLGELSRLTTIEAQAQYIEGITDLTWILCNCTTTKVAEVPLEPDGGFNACFYLTPFLLFGCTRRVQYKVIQFQEEGSVVVYDGPARGESFSFSDDAVLSAGLNAESCDEPDYDLGPEPFVALERIGSTWADNMIYTGKAAGIDPQDGETSFKPLAATDGLVNTAEQPWGKTLSLRFQFHPGLQALGADKYRVRVVGVDDNGNANGFVRTLNNGISWRKYYDKGGGEPGIRWESLNLPGGFYKIPYPDLLWPWLGGQFHAAVDTTDLANGRYLFVVDLYKDDGSNTRLVPQPLAAGFGEQQANFEYRRLKGPLTDPTQDMIEVNHKALANLFLVNNQPCQGEIHGIAHGNNNSLDDCQFLAGPATDEVRINYTALHASGFQWWHWVRVKRGLHGSWQYFDLSPAAGDQTTSSANVPGGFTQPEQFGDLLSHDVPPEDKCSFTVQLHVRAKHTNGSRRLNEYDRWPTGSFAIEIV